MCGFRKYPYPPSTEGICPMTPPPLQKFQFSFTHCLNFWLFDTPPPPPPPPTRNFQSLLWGEYGYFLEPNNIMKNESGKVTGLLEDMLPWTTNLMEESRNSILLVKSAWSIKQLRAFQLDGMLVHCRVTPSIKTAGIHLYTWVERGTMRVKTGPVLKPRLQW